MKRVEAPKYGIGTRFKTRGKHPRECRVVDILRTYDSECDLVKVRYVATHVVAGQTVTDSDVCETTVAMGLLPD